MGFEFDPLYQFFVNDTKSPRIMEADMFPSKFEFVNGRVMTDHYSVAVKKRIKSSLKKDLILGPQSSRSEEIVSMCVDVTVNRVMSGYSEFIVDKSIDSDIVSAFESGAIVRGGNKVIKYTVNRSVF